MTKAEITALADRSADRAVRQTFRMFGVDTDDQDSVNAFNSDLKFARELRKTSEGISSKILMVIIGVAVIGAMTAMMKGFGFSGK